MNLNSLVQFCVGVVIAWCAVTHIDDIRRSIFRAQAVLMYDSRASSWGSSDCFKQEKKWQNRRGAYQH
jgi:hypothetical protein